MCYSKINEKGMFKFEGKLYIFLNVMILYYFILVYVFILMWRIYIMDCW